MQQLHSKIWLLLLLWTIMYTQNQSTQGKRHLTYKCPIQSSHLNLEQWDIHKHAELLSHRNAGNASICFSKVSLKQMLDKTWLQKNFNTYTRQGISSVKKSFVKSQVCMHSSFRGQKFWRFAHYKNCKYAFTTHKYF